MAETFESVDELIVDAARAAVRRLAPEEIEVFDQVYAGWRRQGGSAAQWSRPGGSVGFGIDSVLLTEVALQSISAAVTEVLVVGATAAGTMGLGWLRRRRRAASAGESAAPPLPGSPSGSAGVADAPPATALTDTQVTRLREACRRHAVALGLSTEQAELLADALVGALDGTGPR